MRVGVTLFAQNYSDWDRHDASDWDAHPKVPDSQIFDEEVAIGDLVEPLGFDSMWAIEHHFSPYSLDANTLQFLTFFAARTSRIDFGTMVVVLPWHDPIRVAEEASMLDNFLAGRKLSLGFGRGASKLEFDGLRIDMNTSRERFLEALEVVRGALSESHFSFEGNHFQIPDVSIRPRPRSPDLLSRMHMAWGSPSSVAVAAENGLLPLITPQKRWEVHVKEIEDYNRIRMANGFEPGQPVVPFSVYCSEDEDEANTVGLEHIRQYADSARRHYRLDDPTHLVDVKGYDYYNETARQWVKDHPDAMKEQAALAEALQSGQLSSDAVREAAMNHLVDLHVWGTPEQVLEQIKDRMTGVGGREFLGIFKFGDMPLERAESNIRLFAQRVLPALKEFKTPPPLVPAS